MTPFCQNPQIEGSSNWEGSFPVEKGWTIRAFEGQKQFLAGLSHFSLCYIPFKYRFYSARYIPNGETRKKEEVGIEVTCLEVSFQLYALPISPSLSWGPLEVITKCYVSKVCRATQKFYQMFGKATCQFTNGQQGDINSWASHSVLSSKLSRCGCQSIHFFESDSSHLQVMVCKFVNVTLTSPCHSSCPKTTTKN